MHVSCPLGGQGPQEGYSCLDVCCPLGVCHITATLQPCVNMWYFLQFLLVYRRSLRYLRSYKWYSERRICHFLVVIYYVTTLQCVLKLSIQYEHEYVHLCIMWSFCSVIDGFPIFDNAPKPHDPISRAHNNQSLAAALHHRHTVETCLNFSPANRFGFLKNRRGVMFSKAMSISDVFCKIDTVGTMFTHVQYIHKPVHSTAKPCHLPQH